MIANLLTTGSGWLLRKANELITIGAASAGTYAATHHVPDSVISPGQAFLVAGGSWLVSLGLSWAADKANKALPPK